MSTHDSYTFVASCAAGLEKGVFEEISAFKGENAISFPGGVQWQGSLATAYRACLWSRFASRIYLLLARFSIADTDQLYEGCRRIPWDEHFSEDHSFAVTATLGGDAAVTHNHYAALRLKDAVVDQFRDRGKQRPNVAKYRPDIPLHLHIQKEEALVYLDLSGESLHRRGYRKNTGIAPLKETLAAYIVALSGWDAKAGPETVFLDPMCGSATLLIEAAMIYGDTAPGLSRTYYGFHKWPAHDGGLWSDLVEEAIEREEAGLTKSWPRFIGYDGDAEMVAAARKNIAGAGLEDKIEVSCRQVAVLEPPSRAGYLVSNLPYGERLLEKNRVKHLYSFLGTRLKSRFSGWKAGLFIAEPDLADKLGLDSAESVKLYNGPLTCRLITGTVSEAETQEPLWKISRQQVEGEGNDFANRFRKNMKKYGSWAQKNNIRCFRVYDKDLPDYNVAIDIYGGWLLVQEYAAPASVDAEVAQRRFSIVLATLRQLFGIGRERIFVKRRSRQRGKDQYQKKQVKEKYHEVVEGDCRFLVNFSNYLDAGLFLDHRPVRMKIGEMARGKRFLNLFGYTGTATVHAAKGGATDTTTVDLSANYLEWAKNNLALNGFAENRHRMISDDCLAWLRREKGEYDIIFIDPPTFSNSKKTGRVFDIQKQHVELITLAAGFLAEKGVLFFSTNSRRFRLEKEVAEKFDIRDISRETIPFDFQRNKNIHKCWEIRTK